MDRLFFMIYKNSDKINIRGFTLIELSIVIVVIGLIVAGVVGGQSLVKQAKLRAVMSELGQFKIAVNAFKLEYNNIPGDMPRAFDYWGSQNGCTNSVAISNSSNPQGCNGNGDRRISHWGGEGYRSWQHLALADLIPGSYPGRSIGCCTAEIGLTVPASKRDNTGFIIVPSVDRRPLDFVAGGQRGGPSTAKTFSPKELHSIDIKHDDGVAGEGVVRGHNGQAGGQAPYSSITAGTCLSGGDYDLSLDSKECSMRYLY